jgi:hypothetical protein
MSKRTSTSRELAESVARFLASFESEEVPHGWYTVASLAKAVNCQPRTSERIVNRMLRVKQADRKTFRVFMANHLRPVVHYRFTPAALRALGLTKPKR